MAKASTPARVLASTGILLLVSLVFGVARAQGAVFSADAVKAAFLYRFAAYVEWPSDAPGTPLVIAVVGADDVARQLEELLPRVKAPGGPPQVRRVTRIADLDGVHILYVGSASLSRTRVLRRHALERPILIVTDDERGFEHGGVINFVEVDRNVRFEISQVAADRARLKVDSALLSVATRVERRPQGWIPCGERRECPRRVAGLGVGDWR